jgi:transcriptional regulator with XRE-family HTH domain
MNKLRVYIDNIKVKADIKSDRQLAIKIGIDPSYLCEIIKGTKMPSDKHCIKLAEIAGEEPEKVILFIHACNAKKEAQPIWNGLLKKVVGIALNLTLVFSIIQENLYIM